MFGYQFLRSAAVALGLYGVFGILLALVMLVVVTSTFDALNRFQGSLATEQAVLVQSLRAVAATVRDTSSATAEFQRSIEAARRSADDASKLANDTAGTFRELGAVMNIQIFGLQPLATIAPQFDHSADQLTLLAISLGSTRDALGQNGRDVQRVGTDLQQLQRQVEAMAGTVSQASLLNLGARTLLPFQIAFYGMCLLVLLQSAFSLVAGVALYRLSRAMGTAPLFPFLAQPALPQPRTATTNAADARDPAPTSTPAR